MASFFGNIVRNFISTEGPSGDTVTQVSVSEYIRIPIIAREDCLVLYGPNASKKYDLLLQKPVEDTRTSAFSLFRVMDSTTAQVRFLSLKDVLLPLIQVIPHEILNVSSLQKLCDIVRDNSTWTVAHVVANCGYSQAFSHPDIMRQADTVELDQKQTALHIAIKNEDLSMIKTLLELKVGVDETDIKGNSVYHLAAATNKNIINAVTSRSSKLLNAPNFMGKSPLHLACEADKPECVKALLLAGADVNVAATHDSSLPIHTAINVDSTLCAKEIIDMYPNQLNAEDMKDGGTPLHWATSRQMVNALVELGCRVNAANFKGSTALHNMVMHKRLPCVVALLSWGAEVNLRNEDGQTPLHLASTPSILQAILVFGADLSITNNKGENARHVLSTSSHKEKNIMLYLMHAVGAPRCLKPTTTCNAGCSPSGKFDGIPLETNVTSRHRTCYDDFLDDAMSGLNSQYGFSTTNDRSGRILCLDGGGMKGLVLIQILMILHKLSRRPINKLFDWISGTSTGGILALAIAAGKSPAYCQGLYFRMKDLVFVGQRPYDEKPLEEILKKEFGTYAHMADITDVKVCVTGVLADRFPADLHLFRNYQSGEELLNVENGVTEAPVFDPTKPPNEQLIWQAARASGAAPSYFKAFGRFIDGGLISNNPTLDVLTEIMERNCVLTALGRADETENVRAVVSLGTGKPPVSKVQAIDVFRPESLFKTLQMAFGLSNMAKLLIDQATMADNRTVDRARAWCGMCGITYMRLSPQLSLDIPLDETSDDILLNMLWETLLYCVVNVDKIKCLLRILTGDNYMDVS